MEDFDRKIIALYPWIRNKARYYCRSKEDVDDLASETVCRLLQNRDKYDDSMDMKPWCSVVMKNIYYNYYQRTHLIPFVCYDDYYSPTIDDSSDYEEKLRIMQTLSKSSNNVYCVELYVRGYSYEEISRMLNIKIGTVRSRIYNGRNMLRIAFDD